MGNHVSAFARTLFKTRLARLISISQIQTQSKRFIKIVYFMKTMQEN